jgi:hypothetical protein
MPAARVDGGHAVSRCVVLCIFMRFEARFVIMKAGQVIGVTCIITLTIFNIMSRRCTLTWPPMHNSRWPKQRFVKLESCYIQGIIRYGTLSNKSGREISVLQHSHFIATQPRLAHPSTPVHHQPITLKFQLSKRRDILTCIHTYIRWSILPYPLLSYRSNIRLRDLI